MAPGLFRTSLSGALRELSLLNAYYVRLCARLSLIAMLSWDQYGMLSSGNIPGPRHPLRRQILCHRFDMEFHLFPKAGAASRCDRANTINDA